MVLEYAWNVAGWAAIVAIGPIAASSTLSMNPFTNESPKGWAWRYSQQLKDKEHPRSRPFGIPVLVSTLLYIIVGACLVVPLFAIHYNSGGYNGWSIRPLPLVFTVISLATNAFWMVVYLSKCSACTNIGWVQVVSILTSVLGLIYMFDNTKVIYAIFGIPFLVWNVFWFAKNYVEDMYRCDLSMNTAVCGFKV